MTEETADSDPVLLDVKGLLCPLPVLKARKAMKGLPPGRVLRIVATDPMAAIDVPHYCAESGHALVARAEADGVLTFDIRKRGS